MNIYATGASVADRRAAALRVAEERRLAKGADIERGSGGSRRRWEFVRPLPSSGRRARPALGRSVAVSG